MRTERNTISKKIIVGILVPLFVVIACMGFISSLQLQSALETAAQQSRANVSGLALNIIQQNIDLSVRNHVRSIAEQNRDLIAFYDRRVVAGELSLQEAEEEIRAIFLDEEYGKIGTSGYLAGVSSQGVLTIHPVSQGLDASAYDFMQQAMQIRNGYLEYDWKNVGEERARTKSGYVSYYEPWELMVWASSYKSEFLDLLDIDTIQTSVLDMRVGERGYVGLMDSSGILFANQSRFQQSFHSPEESEEVRSQLAAIAREMLQSGEENRGINVSAASGILHVELSRIQETDWILLVHDYAEEYMGIVRGLRWMVLLSVLLAVFIVGFVIRYLVGRITAPLRSIRRIAEQVHSGDISPRIPQFDTYEMQEIGSCFNEVLVAFSDQITTIRESSLILLEATHHLGTAAQEISSTANQQAAAVQEILSTMEDSDEVSKGIASRIGEVVQLATATKESVETGFALIQSSLDKMKDIRQSNAGTIDGIKHLGRQIDSIWEIVTIINGIADQTKIIAFNAELEAASAGEAGKNFQIVAGEIRRLADNTVESTTEIKVKINEIQHASDKLIITSEEGTNCIKEGWEISHNIRGVFEEVLSGSEISAASAIDISHSIRMQVSSFEQIFLTLKQISEGINNFVVSTRDTSDASDRLREIAEGFDNSVQQYRTGNQDE